jgi:2-hydroxymethylglutarate dehydrogenase
MPELHKLKVGFLGLGAMGLPMAKRVVAAGFKLYTSYHRRREPADELAAQGAEVFAAATEVARAADVIITMLPADAELQEVVFGSTGILKGFARGKVLIEMTTGTAQLLADIDRAVRAQGGEVLDAPVSGGTPAAAQGTLTIMVGGDTATLERCRPLLQIMGSRILHVGAVGQGKVVKMVNQILAAIHLLSMAEAFSLGIKCGADVRTLYEVVKNSSGYSKMMDLRLPGFLFAGSFQPGFRLDLMKKDVDLALESARAAGLSLRLAPEVARIFAAASEAGRGAEDFSAAAQYLASLSGADLRARKDSGS